MRRNIQYLYSVLLLLLFAFSGCSKNKLDDITLSTDGNRVSFTLDNVVTTRATGDDSNVTKTEALDREKRVNSLYAVVFERAEGLFFNTFECEETDTAGKYTFDMQRAGDYNFYLIANPDEELKKALEAGPITVEELGALVAKQTPGEDNEAENFLMTSDKVEVTTEAQKVVSVPNHIKLQRVAARFDFYNRVEKLKIESITFKNRYEYSRLAPSLKMEGLEKTSTKKYNFSGYDCIATVYGYENANRGETVFELEATYNGKAVKPYSVVMTNLPIKRNHLYSIIISPKGGDVEPIDPDDPFGSMNIEIVVNDWEEDAVFTWKGGQLLQPLKVYHQVTAIGDTDLLAKYIPRNEEVVETATHKPTTVEVKVTSYVKAGTLEAKVGTNLGEGGVTITPKGEPTKTEDGMFEQLFTVKFTEEPSVNDYQTVELVVKNGTETAELPLTIKHGRPKMPLESVAEYNLARPETEFDIANLKFAKSHDNDKSGYFTGANMEMAYFVDKDIIIDGKTYHVPYNAVEVFSILPFQQLFEKVTHENNILSNEAEKVLFPWQYQHIKDGNTDNASTYYADYKLGKPIDNSNPAEEDRVSYGLRFKNGPGKSYKYLQAFRYEIVGKLEPEELKSHVKVTSRYLGEQFANGSLDEIANEEFWSHHTEDDVTRIFPLAGTAYVKGGVPYIVDFKNGNIELRNRGILASMHLQKVFSIHYSEMFEFTFNVKQTNNKPTEWFFGGGLGGVPQYGRTIRLFETEKSN